MMRTLAVMAGLAMGALAGSVALARPVPVNPAITPNDPLPRRVLDCGGSIITRIADRFGKPLDGPAVSGSSVTFSNGGYVVGYETVEAIGRSRVGDHVLICLVKIPDPDRCPPGDMRGRFYTVTNLRTLESWTLPDANHMCGGA
jgi:hypothetical protein